MQEKPCPLVVRLLFLRRMPILLTMTGIGQHAGNFVKISIRDHGIGIAQEYLLRIYDPFLLPKILDVGSVLQQPIQLLNDTRVG
jgi:hypothetical protein